MPNTLQIHGQVYRLDDAVCHLDLLLVSIPPRKALRILMPRCIEEKFSIRSTVLNVAGPNLSSTASLHSSISLLNRFLVDAESDVDERCLQGVPNIVKTTPLEVAYYSSDNKSSHRKGN